MPKRAADARFPRIKPITPVRGSIPFDDPGWIVQPKHDGFRGIAYVTPDGCVLESRQRIRFTRFGHLADAIRAELTVDDAILDGEIVALDEEGRPQFRHLMRKGVGLAYAVFDLLWLNGEDLRPRSLADRLAHLDTILPASRGLMLRVPSLTENGEEFYRVICEADLEGVVGKRLKDPYRDRTTWYKQLNPTYSQGEGRRALFRKRGRRGG